MTEKKADTVTKFWKQVEKGHRCWLWIGHTNRDGYGRLAVYHRGMQLAHRISWEIHNGPIPDGLNVLHHCDIPACVNPSHLYLGTQKDNVRDMIVRGRANWENRKAGEENGNAKLTETEVREIRKLHAIGNSTRRLARIYQVGKTTVKHVVNRDTWKHI